MLKNRILKWVNPFLRLPVAGLDISDTTVKYLRFKPQNEKVFFDFFGEFNLPEGMIKDGEIVNEAGLAEALKKKLNKDCRRLFSYFLAVSLPEEKSFLRLIQLPKVKLEEVANAVRWEIEANVPLPAEDLIYDYEVVEPLDDHLNHMDVVITAFPKSIVGSYLRVLKGAGLKIFCLELESQAIVRSAVADLRQKKAVMLVDMGRNRTSLIIIAGGAIFFTTTVKLGGISLEKDIASRMGVSQEQAALFKETVGLNKIAESGKVHAALLPTVSILAEEIKRVAAYYRDHARHAHGGSSAIEHIYLLGGDANLFGLDTFFSSALKIPTSLADPFSAFKNKLGSIIPPMPKNKALKFGTASGLALRGNQLC